jgi:hypothetical protein
MHSLPTRHSLLLLVVLGWCAALLLPAAAPTPVQARDLFTELRTCCCHPLSWNRSPR